MFKVNSLFLIITLMIQAQSCQGQVKDRDYWIERYLSVSYPLQQIKVTSPFGNRKDPFTGKLAYHGGLDLKAKNEYVLSMFDGYVEQIGEDGRSGRFVILRHGDYQVSYCHLSKVLATEGEEILAGDIVGVTGNTGRSTGEHLHITCRYKGDKHDPYLLLQSIQRIRKQCSDALEQEGLSDSSRVAFIEKYAPAAMEQQCRYGIPASVTLAQMVFESKWGQSKMAVLDHNYFGIKANSRWLAKGLPYNLYDDDKPNEKFCVFPDAAQSMEYHSQVLLGDRYARCFLYAPTDWHNWLVEIIRAGYATSDIYVKECSKIIEKYRLYEYDQIAMNGQNNQIKEDE